MDTTEILNKFYTAFQKRDYTTMQSCYHADAVFSDPVFRNLSSLQTKAMWHMLCERGKDLVIRYKIINEHTLQWEADYSFSKTGRTVHNRITAKFEFEDGLILQHTDTFDLWKWSGMALGFSGKLLGWTPFLQSKIRKMAMAGLNQFISKHPEYQQ